MEVQEKQVILRKLVASKGKVIVSKTVDEEGKPTVQAKELYLGVGDSADNYEEIDEPESVVE